MITTASPLPFDLLDSGTPGLYDIHSHAPGPQGKLPLTDAMLRNWSSGDLFGLTQDAGMGWDPSLVGGKEYLILSTSGGLRADDGTPIALGYHTGHWELGLLMRAAAEEFKSHGTVPYAGYCSDPCDGRTQGTPGMMDSLAYRNDAAIVLRRLIRSLPRRRGVMGVATCDKGLPAMMMALAAMRDLPCVLVPGGVTLPPTVGEDNTKIQSISSRYVHGMLTLEEAQDLGCKACGTPGGGCQFLGTAATSQVVGEALGLSLIHSALAPSGQPVWLDLAMRSARALMNLEAKKLTTAHILTDSSIRNAMVVHAAFGGSTNLLLHIPAIAHASGLRRPTVQDWQAINTRTPRLVDVRPNGPTHYATVHVYLAGGVPEVMLHLRDLALIDDTAMTVAGEPWGALLDWWQTSDRRKKVRDTLARQGINPDEVIMTPARAKERGLTSTITFPLGNLAPDGSVIKSTSIDPSVVGEDGIYRMTGPAKVFLSERSAIAAVKQGGIKAGDVLVLICCGPAGSGMEETYQLTSALRDLPFGKQVAVITDARFSGVSTGACIGHVGPEALAGGPIGKIVDGDLIRIVIDRNKLTGTLDFIGPEGKDIGTDAASKLLAGRLLRSDLRSNAGLPADTRLWAALQAASGGTWGGCVYDVESIVAGLKQT
ncbi:MAG TPA: YjhG/YagF family D-xylonate dehydratase [Phycisphaerae bacterium]